MFDSSYPFKYICNRFDKAKSEDDVSKTVHIFAFYGKKGHKYIVEVEQYEYHLYALKYYLKHHQDSSNKYKLTSRLNEMQPVIRTCLNIMLDLYSKDPLASFGFIGSPSLNETTNHTQRHRIYSRVMENFFSPQSFQHYSDPGKSIYFIVNQHASRELAEGLETHIVKIWNVLCQGTDYTPFDK